MKLGRIKVAKKINTGAQPYKQKVPSKAAPWNLLSRQNIARRTIEITREVVPQCVKRR
jgi:hypothetical protein